MNIELEYSKLEYGDEVILNNGAKFSLYIMAK